MYGRRSKSFPISIPTVLIDTVVIQDLDYDTFLLLLVDYVQRGRETEIIRTFLMTNTGMTLGQSVKVTSVIWRTLSG